MNGFASKLLEGPQDVADIPTLLEEVDWALDECAESILTWTDDRMDLAAAQALADALKGKLESAIQAPGSLKKLPASLPRVTRKVRLPGEDPLTQPGALDHDTSATD